MLGRQPRTDEQAEHPANKDAREYDQTEKNGTHNQLSRKPVSPALKLD
jgi:hypothetical protein